MAPLCYRRHRFPPAIIQHHLDERGAVGIRLEPAAAIVRRRGGQTRRAP
jgi:hypothetical protein